MLDSVVPGLSCKMSYQQKWCVLSHFGAGSISTRTSKPGGYRTTALWVSGKAIVVVKHKCLEVRIRLFTRPYYRGSRAVPRDGVTLSTMRSIMRKLCRQEITVSGQYRALSFFWYLCLLVSDPAYCFLYSIKVITFDVS